MKSNAAVVDDLLKSVDKLSLENRILFKEKMQKRAKEDLKKLMDKIGERNKHFSEEEVMADIDKAIKEIRYGHD